jgi:phage-related baseplate assembly protein
MKSGLDMTPNSSRLNSSLKELSLEKERPVADDVGSQHTAATKKKLQAKPAQGVPPEQTVKGTLPQHQRLLDEAGPSDPGRF